MTDEEIYLPAARSAADAFGLPGCDLDLVVVGENVTYRARAGNDEYVLRLHRPGYHTLAELDSERVWLDALGSAGVSVPEPACAPDGRYFVPVMVADDDERFAGLTRWREGEVMAESNDAHISVAARFAQLGELMACMHDQAAGWDPPAGFARPRLDADGLVGDNPFWGRFWEVDDLTSDERTALAAARTLAHDRLVAYGEPAATFSVIHADLHLGNLLIDDVGQLSVIDFDDAGFGWHQYDMAVALVNIRRSPDGDTIEHAFVDAYRAVRPITHDDLAWIPFFEAVRRLALIGWKGQRPDVEWPDGRFRALVDDALAHVDDLEEP